MKPLAQILTFLLLSGAMAQTPPKQPSKPTPAAVDAKTPPASKTVPATVGVTVTTDTPCSFKVDGKAVADTLRPGEPIKLHMSRQMHKLEAVSVSASRDIWTGSIDLSRANTKPTVNIELLPIEAKRLEKEAKAPSKLAQLVARWVFSVIKSKVNPMEGEGFRATWTASTTKPIRITFSDVEHALAMGDSGVIDAVPVSGRLALSITGEVNFVDANRPANLPSDAWVQMSKNVVFSMNSGGFDCYGRFVVNGTNVGIDGDATFTSNDGEASFGAGTKVTVDGHVYEGLFSEKAVDSNKGN